MPEAATTSSDPGAPRRPQAARRSSWAASSAPVDSGQPRIADILGIRYEHPIADHAAWSEVFPDPDAAPEPPHPAMFHGPLGHLTRCIASHVPWDPVAFHMQALVALGNYLGYAPFVEDGANQRRANLFLAVVGNTASGKGSSFAFVDWLLAQLDAAYRSERVITAVGSGEGLLSKITDPVYIRSPKGDEVLSIPGSEDKRVLYVEEELGALFNKMVAQESVEKMITKAWDSGVLETATKKESMRCTQPHVSIVGHITPDELYERLDKRLVDNGFSNRWLYVLIKKTAVIVRPPAPHQIPGAIETMRVVKSNLEAARSRITGPVELTDDATRLFADTHAAMTGHRFGGAMSKQSARWAPQIHKLAVVYAAIDGATAITAMHIAAARAAWAYNHRSAAAFFAGMTGNQHADQLLQMWREIDYADLTLTDIDEMFSKHMSAQKRSRMLERLSRDGVIARRAVQNPGGGRPATVISYSGATHRDNPATAW